jgi:hypothetical protein
MSIQLCRAWEAVPEENRFSSAPSLVVRATAEATSPDLDALAALDAYLARFGVGPAEIQDYPREGKKVRCAQ